MIKNCLLYIMNPIGFIAGISAVKTLHGSNKVAVHILVEWPGSDTITGELAKIITIFSKNFPSIKKIVSKNKGNFGEIEFDEIYFPHNMNKGSTDFLFEKYPKAKRICCGDSFGVMYTRKSFVRLFGNPTAQKDFLSTLKSKTYAILQYLRHPQWKFFEKNYKIHQAAVVLPVDQSGEFFKHIPLIVCQKETVMGVIKKCFGSSQKLQNYIRKMLKPFGRQKIFVLLTENFAEANLVPFEKEIEMYCAIIKKYCCKDDILFLKPHHGEALPRGQKIIERLSGYNIFELKKDFTRYPIEIWQALLDRALIITAGYPVLSLKYLYNIDVIQPFDQKFIKKWFPQGKQIFINHGVELYAESIKRLKRWDGRGPLYVRERKI